MNEEGVAALLIADARPLMVLEGVLIPLAGDKSPLFVRCDDPPECVYRWWFSFVFTFC